MDKNIYDDWYKSDMVWAIIFKHLTPETIDFIQKDVAKRLQNAHVGAVLLYGLDKKLKD